MKKIPFARLPAKFIVYGIGRVFTLFTARYYQDVAGFYAALLLLHMAAGNLFEWLERGAENIRKQ